MNRQRRTGHPPPLAKCALLALTMILLSLTLRADEPLSSTDDERQARDQYLRHNPSAQQTTHSPASSHEPESMIMISEPAAVDQQPAAIRIISPRPIQP